MAECLRFGIWGSVCGCAGLLLLLEGRPAQVVGPGPPLFPGPSEPAGTLDAPPGPSCPPPPPARG